MPASVDPGVQSSGPPCCRGTCVRAGPRSRAATRGCTTTITQARPISTGTIAWKASSGSVSSSTAPVSAAEDRRDPEPDQAAPLAGQLGAVADRPAERARHQTDGVADVGQHRRVAHGQQHREGDQGPRPDDGVDRARRPARPGRRRRSPSAVTQRPAHRRGLVRDRIAFPWGRLRPRWPVKAAPPGADVGGVTSAARGLVALAALPAVLLLAAACRSLACAAESGDAQAKKPPSGRRPGRRAAAPRRAGAARLRPGRCGPGRRRRHGASAPTQDADRPTGRQAAGARRPTTSRVRALYMAGGSAALYASVLDAHAASDRRARAGSPTCSARLRPAPPTPATSRRAPTRCAAGPVGSSAAAEKRDRHGGRGAAQRYDEPCRPRSTRRAPTSPGSVAAGEVAGRRRRQPPRGSRALDAAVARSGSARVAAASRRARARVLPSSLYVAAAQDLPGMSWTLLAAIGQVETGHGATPDVSYAGAQGPMQFMPAPSRRTAWTVTGTATATSTTRPTRSSAPRTTCARTAPAAAARRWPARSGTTTTPTGTCSPGAEAGRPVRASDPEPQARLTCRVSGLGSREPAGQAGGTGGRCSPEPSMPPMPLSASPSSLGTIQTLLASPCAIFGRVWRYW